MDEIELLKPQIFRFVSGLALPKTMHFLQCTLIEFLNPDITLYILYPTIWIIT